MGKMRMKDGGGIVLMHYWGNIQEGPGSLKHKDPGSSEGESLQLGTARALGKVAIDKCISMSQPCCWG